MNSLSCCGVNGNIYKIRANRSKQRQYNRKGNAQVKVFAVWFYKLKYPTEQMKIKNLLFGRFRHIEQK